MICICGHTDKEHWNFGNGKCDRCNCAEFKAGADNSEDSDPREWGEE